MSLGARRPSTTCFFDQRETENTYRMTTLAELSLDEPSRIAEPRLEDLVSPSRGVHIRLLPAFVALCVVVLDVGLVAGAFMLAYVARFSPDETVPSLGLDHYLRMALIEGLLATGLFATHGLYNFERPQAWPVRLRAVISSSATALVLAVTISYFLGDQAFSRLWLAVGWFLSIVAVAAWRAVAHRIYEKVRDALAPTNRVLIVGANRLGRELSQELGEHFDVVGFVDNGTDLDGLELPLLGPIAQLDEVIQAYAVDEVVIALPSTRREQVSRVLERGFHRQVRVKLVPDFAGLVPERFELHRLGGRPYIGFMPAAAVSWAKRAIDLVLVGFGVVALLPLFAIVGLAIKLNSPGPIFYRQVRVGKNGRHFGMLKFRSMCVDADRHLEALQAQNEASGPLFKMKRDPRVTRVGAVLRRWSIDELPQLINVLRGEMSLVGPRPPIPAEVAKYEDWQLGRLRAVPGLTGLWQVSGRSDVPFHDMVRLDLHYIRNWSLALDLEILLRTIPAVLSNRGAY
jgi:exopolysaccharide biosynthesis polyprenyl glycosylphosphotransferase